MLIHLSLRDESQSSCLILVCQASRLVWRRPASIVWLGFKRGTVASWGSLPSRSVLFAFKTLFTWPRVRSVSKFRFSVCGRLQPHRLFNRHQVRGRSEKSSLRAVAWSRRIMGVWRVYFCFSFSSFSFLFALVSRAKCHQQPPHFWDRLHNCYYPPTLRSSPRELLLVH